jgi:hypothetical protein
VVVQAAGPLIKGSNDTTWKRTYIRNISPRAVQVASWAIDRFDDRSGWTTVDWLKLVGGWTACSLSLIVLVSPTSLGFYVFLNNYQFPPMLWAKTSTRNNGAYDPIPYFDWNYATDPSNLEENLPSRRNQLRNARRRLSILHSREHQLLHQNPPQQYRGFFSDHELTRYFGPDQNSTLLPYKLCMLSEELEKRKYTGAVKPGEAFELDDWMKSLRVLRPPKYMFIVWTATQFRLADKTPGGDWESLHALAERATREAGLTSFWISSKCLRKNKDGLNEDIYRISDVVRGASAIAIIAGPSTNSRHRPMDLKEMLFGVGERKWTLPELILGPKDVPVKIYYRDPEKNYRDNPPPDVRRAEIEARNLPTAIWQDAYLARYLMDHYQGTVALTPLELVVVALKCLANRKVGETRIEQGGRGETSYVLMGLLRRRPKVNVDDSGFEAFARLSLANDIQLLLERLICIMPRNFGQRWDDTSDFWNAELWDIYPSCQVAGIASRDSILLDNVVGGTIKWDRFERVACAQRDAKHRRLIRTLLPISPLIPMSGIVMILLPSGRVIGAILLVLGLIILGVAPYLIRLLYSGKVWDTQAFFFGFEGYMDIKTIEQHIFGGVMGHLSWSPYASTLSDHSPGAHDECNGKDPIENEETLMKVEQAYQPSGKLERRSPKMRIFTLVDTFTMTVTLFEAARPPVAVLVCGAEGGMQRAILCSYRSDTNTFHRETVLRMQTRVLGRMARVSRLRLSILPRDSML